ncbi:MAG TPA: hypothetical protein O0X70_07750 [Methanocorpusculum sp.]|nr:hypothetical protein [Methanocorpusculum sp.]
MKKVLKEEGVKEKKERVYVGVLIGLVIAGLLVLGGLLLINPIVDAYLSDTKQIVASYAFLETKADTDETMVFFIGSSIIGTGIDSDTINQILNEKGYEDITAYNLGIDADNSLGR